MNNLDQLTTLWCPAGKLLDNQLIPTIGSNPLAQRPDNIDPPAGHCVLHTWKTAQYEPVEHE